MTINRFCSSGLQAIALAAGSISAGYHDIVVAGGVESMSMVPMTGNKLSASPEAMARMPPASSKTRSCPWAPSRTEAASA